LTLEIIDHAQLAMPRGEEDKARPFYRDLLGLPEQPKPPELAKRGGCWFESDKVKVHLGVEDPFRPAKKAHIAFRVTDVQGLAARARAAGYEVVDDELLEGFDRIYIYDPFGNRLEFLRPINPTLLPLREKVLFARFMNSHGSVCATPHPPTLRAGPSLSRKGRGVLCINLK